jgi:hypothetical protein
LKLEVDTVHREDWGSLMPAIVACRTLQNLTVRCTPRQRESHNFDDVGRLKFTSALSEHLSALVHLKHLEINWPDGCDYEDCEIENRDLITRLNDAFKANTSLLDIKLLGFVRQDLIPVDSYMIRNRMNSLSTAPAALLPLAMDHPSLKLSSPSKNDVFALSPFGKRMNAIFLLVHAAADSGKLGRVGKRRRQSA